VETLTASAVEWLLASDEPAVRLLTRRDVLGEHAAEEDVLAGPWVRATAAGSRPSTASPAGAPRRRATRWPSAAASGWPAIPDGRWQPGGYWWSPTRVKLDVVDWGRSGPNQMITLNALRVLKAAGRMI
jgi:hypothetical protein